MLYVAGDIAATSVLLFMDVKALKSNTVLKSSDDSANDKGALLPTLIAGIFETCALLTICWVCVRFDISKIVSGI